MENTDYPFVLQSYNVVEIRMELFHIDDRDNDFAQVVRFVSRQGKRLSDLQFVLLFLVLSVSRPQIEWFNVAERVKDGTKKMLRVNRNRKSYTWSRDGCPIGALHVLAVC